MLMQKRRQKGYPTQLDLLQPPPMIPRWEDLPAQVREQVLPLLVRLLKEHHLRDGEPESQREVGDE